MVAKEEVDRGVRVGVDDRPEFFAFLAERDRFFFS
jgi:hypothetical protein